MAGRGQKTGRRGTNQQGIVGPERDAYEDSPAVGSLRKSRTQLAISSSLLLLWILFLASIAWLG